jgi:hypothetical protein
MGFFEKVAIFMMNHPWLVFLGPLVVCFVGLSLWCYWQWKHYKMSILTDYTLSSTISETHADEYKLLKGLPLPPTNEETIYTHLSIYTQLCKLMKQLEESKKDEPEDNNKEHERIFWEGQLFFQNHAHHFSDDVRKTISRYFDHITPLYVSSLENQENNLDREDQRKVWESLSLGKVTLSELKIYMRDHLLQEKIH